MQQSQVFVVYDCVQYDKGSWRNRNRIKTPRTFQWLTVPVLTKGRFGQMLREVHIDNHLDWKSRHLRSIRQNYAKAPFFKQYIEIFDRTYSMEWEYLVDLDMHLIFALRQALGITTPIVFSSEMKIEGDREHRLIDICKSLGADEFLEGSAGRNYLEGVNEQMFKDAGIKITYHDYKHPTYPQVHGDFVPYLSVVDLLFCQGPKSLEILSTKPGEKNIAVTDGISS